MTNEEIRQLLNFAIDAVEKLNFLGTTTSTPKTEALAARLKSWLARFQQTLDTAVAEGGDVSSMKFKLADFFQQVFAAKPQPDDNFLNLAWYRLMNTVETFIAQSYEADEQERIEACYNSIADRKMVVQMLEHKLSFQPQTTEDLSELPIENFQSLSREVAELMPVATVSQQQQQQSPDQASRFARFANPEKVDLDNWSPVEPRAAARQAQAANTKLIRSQQQPKSAASSSKASSSSSSGSKKRPLPQRRRKPQASAVKLEPGNPIDALLIQAAAAYEQSGGLGYVSSSTSVLKRFSMRIEIPEGIDADSVVDRILSIRRIQNFQKIEEGPNVTLLLTGAGANNFARTMQKLKATPAPLKRARTDGANEAPFAALVTAAERARPAARAMLAPQLTTFWRPEPADVTASSKPPTRPTYGSGSAAGPG